jgi:RNA polymerase sigma factor FliA
MTTLTQNKAIPKISRYSRCDSTSRFSEDDLVQDNLPLVKSMVGRIAMTLPAHVDPDDLYSAGLVGLLHALRHFDPKGGSSFESYAKVRIRGAIFDELRRLDWVPRSVHEKARKVQAAIQQLEQIKGEAPSDFEVAVFMDLSIDEYERLLGEIKPATFVCLDSVLSQDADTDSACHAWIADAAQESPLDTVSRRDLSELVSQRLAELPEMQRKVLALYYYEGLRLREIAALFGVTESRICQIHSQAILNIKTYIASREQSALAI